MNWLRHCKDKPTNPDFAGLGETEFTLALQRATLDGLEAKWEGLPQDDCPYTYGTFQWTGWQNGWNKGRVNPAIY